MLSTKKVKEIKIVFIRDICRVSLSLSLALSLSYVQEHIESLHMHKILFIFPCRSANGDSGQRAVRLEDSLHDR